MPFSRFRGDGGDGGVECLARWESGRVVGWQAKYVFEVSSLIKQADESLTTALKVYPDLTEFILCFPFNLTGPTGRKKMNKEPAESETDKIERWIEKSVVCKWV